MSRCARGFLVHPVVTTLEFIAAIATRPRTRSAFGSLLLLLLPVSYHKGHFYWNAQGVDVLASSFYDQLLRDTR